MSFESSKPEVESPHRPTVRIVKRRMPPQAALISLLVASAAAAVAYGAWRVWRDDFRDPVVTRTLEDVVLNYKCERSHTFVAMGQAEPLKCPQCGTPAYAVATYVCPVHGDTEVAVDFELNAYGEPVMARLRLSGGKWVDVDVGLRCPRCGQPLHREYTNPLASLGDERKGVDGEGPPRRPAIPPSEEPRPQPSPPGEPKTPAP
jgi:uncharacterized protein (UPF0212 family)